MAGIEIFLIVVGSFAIVISFACEKQFKKIDGESGNYSTEIDDELIQKKINEVIDEIIDEKVESTEVKIEKILNEKIMTVGEYSDNVISEIDKNHNEVMFLYGMLSDKEKEVKNTLIDIENIKKSIKKAEIEQNNMQVDASQINADGQMVTESVKSNNGVTGNNNGNVRNNKNNRNNRNNRNNNKLSNNRSDEKGNNNKSGVAMSTKQAKEKTNNNEKILEQYRQGKTPVEIAKNLKIGIGEVRLVIDLYKNR